MINVEMGRSKWQVRRLLLPNLLQANHPTSIRRTLSSVASILRYGLVYFNVTAAIKQRESLVSNLSQACRRAVFIPKMNTTKKVSIGYANSPKPQPGVFNLSVGSHSSALTTPFHTLLNMVVG